MTPRGFLHGCLAAALAGLLYAFPPAPASPQNASPAPQEMEVLGVATDQQSGQPMVLLRGKTDRRALTLVIDPSAALGIALPLQGVTPPRPYTHDLLLTVIRRAGYAIEKVVITDLKENTYFATLTLRRGTERLEIDSRPSDAIAVALRAGAPILAAEAALKAPPEEKSP
ncbi:MAG: bifunctional nuclease family protein [candidate division NC10 bacterium]|nr:bifunctional nuclease family protein [candidate division NC10 bacterium]